MAFVPDTQPQVPSGDAPILGVDQSRGGMGGLVEVPGALQGGSVQTDPNKQNPTFVPDEQPYSARTPGALDAHLPTALQPYAGRIADIATGANETLAGALAIPANSVANIFQGLAGHPFTSTDEMKQSIQQGLRAIPGMGAAKEQAFNKWYENLGEDAGKQALLTMALIAGAGPLAAMGNSALKGAVPDLGVSQIPGTAGLGSISNANVSGAKLALGAVAKNVGETAVMHPSLVAASDAASVLGGKLAPMAAGPLQALGVNANPDVLALLGTLAGGPIGAGLASMRRIRPTAGGDYAGLPKTAGLQLNETMTGAKPILTGDGSFSGQDIQKAIRGTVESATNWIQERVQRVMGDANADPAVTAQRVRDITKQGYEKAREIEGHMWAQVDLRQPVTTTPIKTTALEVGRSAQDASVRAADIPGDLILDIQKWGPSVSIQRMRDLASLARKQAATLGSQGNSAFPSDRLRANLTKIANSIDDQIAAQYPNDMNLAKAKEFSSWLHTTFDRGPLGEFGQVRAQPSMQTDAQSALPSAMRDSRFGNDYSSMAKELGMTPEAQQAAQDYLKSMVAQVHQQAVQPALSPMGDLAAQKAATDAATKYMSNPDFKRFAKAFPAMQNVMNRQLNQLQSATMNALEIQRSQFFNKAGTDPEKAVESLFNSGTKNADTALIMKKIGSDTQAMEALQYGLLRKLGNDARWDPNALAARLNSKDVAPMMRQIMGEDGFGRLKRIIDSGISYESGMRSGNGGALGRTPMATTGRIFGSTITGWLGGKSIQVHSIGTKTGENIMEKWFGLIPPEVILQRAVVDPQWERFLLSRLPDNLSNMRRTTKLLGLMVGSSVAAQQKLMEQSGSGTGSVVGGMYKPSGSTHQPLDLTARKQGNGKQ